MRVTPTNLIMALGEPVIYTLVRKASNSVVTVVFMF